MFRGCSSFNFGSFKTAEDCFWRLFALLSRKVLVLFTFVMADCLSMHNYVLLQEMSHYPFLNSHINQQQSGTAPVFESRTTAQQQFNKIMDEVMQTKGKQKQFNPILDTTQRKKCKLHPMKPSKVCRECRQNDQPTQKPLLETQQPEKKVDNFFELNCETPLYHISQKLKKNVMSSDYFKGLYSLKRFDQVTQQIQSECHSVETFQKGSMQIPTKFMCCFYKLLLMRLSMKEVKTLLNHKSPYVKAAGLLYVRMLAKYSNIYSLLSSHFADQTVFYPTVDKSQQITMGAYTQRLLQQLSHYQLRLPRIPLKLDRQYQDRLNKYQPQKHEQPVESEPKPEVKHNLGILAIVRKQNQTVKFNVLELGSDKIVVQDRNGNHILYDYDEVQLIDDIPQRINKSRSRSRDRHRTRHRKHSSSSSSQQRHHVVPPSGRHAQPPPPPTPPPSAAPISMQSLKANIKKLSDNRLSRYAATEQEGEYNDPLMQTDREQIIRLG